jgi:hypothetical protein
MLPLMFLQVVHKHDPQRAAHLANSLAQHIWLNRAGFVYRSEPLHVSVREAAKLRQKLVGRVVVLGCVVSHLRLLVNRQ